MVKEFTLQWHICNECNLHCIHCYQENYKSKQLSYTKLINILEQYKRFLRLNNYKGHINLTGGEPLYNPNFFKILEYMQKDKDLYSFAILTNGTLITDEIAHRISTYEPQYVQVSIDGDKKTHERIRGKGNLEKTILGIENLNKYGIFTSISFTAQSNNYKTFSKVVKIAQECKARKVWTDRFIPIGGAKKLLKLSLTPKQTQKFLDIVYKEKERLKDNKITHVTMNRALQFLETEEMPYSCTAGTSLLTIMENGDLVLCRRMPIVLGNLLEQDFTSIYNSSKIIKELKNEVICSDCSNCDHSVACKGGLKCLNYAITGKLNGKDPGCWI